MNRADMIRRLAAFPGTAILAAAQAHQVPTGSKYEMITMLADAIEARRITLAQVEASAASATPAALRPSPATPAAAPAAPQWNHLIESVAQAAARAESIGLANKAASDALSERLAGILGQINSIDASIAGIKADAADLRALRVDAAAVQPAITAAVEAAFGPIKAAVKTPAQKAAVKAAAAGPIGSATVAKIFGIDLRDRKGQPLTVELWDSPDAPAIDATYIWQPTVLRALILGQRSPVWLGGEKGVGKTQAAMQFAARTGRPFTRINFHKYSSAEEYMGATGLDGGNTRFVPGPFLSAYTRPGSVILLDEPTLADPGELAPLHGVLERGTPRVNMGGTVWTRAPGVMVLAADNTLSNGDQSGRYSGTRQMNSALADRFALIVPVSWLPAQQEADALVGITGCAPALAADVVRVLNVCRAKAGSGDIVDAPSIRQACAWIEAMPAMGTREAWDCAIGSRQPPEGALQLEAIFAAEVDCDVWDKRPH